MVPVPVNSLGEGPFLENLSQKNFAKSLFYFAPELLAQILCSTIMV